MVPDPTESFRELRPLCLKLSKEPSQQNIKDLESKLRIVDPVHLNQLLEYVLFPLKFILLNENASSGVKESAVGCIEILVRRGHVAQLTTLEDVFSCLSMLLSCRESPGRVANISEELKLCIVNCLTGLLENTSVEVKGAFYSSRYLPVLGHAVSLVLALSEREKAKPLQMAAISCISALACCGENKDSDQSSRKTISATDSKGEPLQNTVRDLVAHAFASFIPGISMALCRIITGDPKQGYAVLTASIDVWGEITSLVMNDKHMPTDPSNGEDVISQLTSVVSKGKTRDSQDVKCEKELPSPVSSDNCDKGKRLTVNRTIDWFQDTASKLKILMERLDTIALHPNWKVRLSLAKFSDKILANCLESLQACTSTLVDLLVGLSRDEYIQVSSFSKMALHNLSQRLESGSGSLSSLCEENLYSLFTALPRLIRGADDAKKIQTLNLAVGYMSLLGNRISSLLYSLSHLKRLSLALVQVLEFDVGDVGIVEERTPSLAETAVLPSETKGKNPLLCPTSHFVASMYPRYHFKHFTDDKVRMAVNQLCYLLGYHGNLSLLVDHFVDLFRESELNRKQVVYILSAVVIGSAGQELDRDIASLSGTSCDSTLQPKSKDAKEIQNVVELLITEYMSDTYWGLVTSNPPTMQSSTSQDLLLCRNSSNQLNTLRFDVLNSNIQLTCLLLEALGVFSRVIGTEFDGYLMRVLYPVMAKLGNDNAAVSRSAYSTLVVFCKSCGYASVDDLIARNADYLVNSISLDFKYIFLNQQAPRVLRVMIQYSNADILFIIKDTLDEIFSVIDLYPDDLMYQLMNVLNVLVHIINKWFPATFKGVTLNTTEEVLGSLHNNKPYQNDNQSEIDQEETRPTSEGICQFFLDYHRRKMQALGHLDEMGDAVEDPGNDKLQTGGGTEGGNFDADKKAEVSQHVEYITQVLEKCVHFLSSESAWLRLLVLDTIETGAKAICQSEDELLPMIHRIWPALVKRFTDDEQVVTIRAVQVLCTLAEASGSFMRRRVVKDALPPLTSFLDKQAPVSLKAGPVYQQSQAFKLQLAILRSLGRLCCQLEISEADLSHVVLICAQYLSSRQPTDLQKVAVTTFENFASLEADLIWLSLNDLYCRPEKLVHPCTMFKPVNMAGVGPHSVEYAKNVKTLLSKI